ncbi:class I SAM-dependent rRNA methyltransferase [soil metagenome]
MAAPIDITVRPTAVEPLRRGHPWLYREQVAKVFGSPPVGAEARILAPDRTPLGRALVAVDEPIAARLFTHDDTPIDALLFAKRIERALALRTALFADGSTNAYRLLHGEGDRLPGFVVDVYDHVAVLRTDGGAAAAAVPRFAEAFGAATNGRFKTFVHRIATKGDAPKIELLAGDAPPDEIVVREHGVPFVVDLAKGQKTGAFLDQRENRKRVGAIARGKRVLNLFSYAGGFSLHAALGGATRVTSVDIAARAHATAQKSFRAAGVDPSLHEFVGADAFAFLESAKKNGRSFDLVISDPPSFAPNERSVPRALAAYRSLHRACTAVLAKDGVLCASSCSSHVAMHDFTATLDDAVTGTELAIQDAYGPPADHPTLPAWPEGRYLKFVVLVRQR